MLVRQVDVRIVAEDRQQEHLDLANLLDGLRRSGQSEGVTRRALRAYLETNVFIEWDRVPKPDQQEVRVAILTGALVAPPSLAEIEEILGPFEQDREAAIRSLAALRRVIGFHGMLKTPPAILEEATVAYAEGAEPPNIALPEAERGRVVMGLVEVLASSTKFDATLTAVLADVRRIKDQWRDTMTLRRAQAMARAQADGLYNALPPPFPVFWHSSALGFAEAFAERYGCADACRRRGLEGLLEVRPLRLGIGAVLSQIYTQLVPTPERRQPRVPSRGDGYDVWHAILAGTADVFVTFDGRLADHMEQIPNAGVRTVRSVRELLKLLN